MASIATRRVSKLIRGLEDVEAFGVTTNHGFLIACLRHPAFAKGDATTAFIGQHRDELLAPRATEDADAALAALLLYVTNPHAPPWRAGRSIAATFPLGTRLDLGHGVREVEIVRERDGGYVASLDGRDYRFEIDELGARQRSVFRSNGLMEQATFLRDGDRLFVLHRGVALSVRDLTLAPPESAAATGGDGKVRAAMNGRVVAVLVKPGETVSARSARDDAGGDEDGARPHRRRRRHRLRHRRRGRRAGDHRQDRGRDRSGGLI